MSPTCFIKFVSEEKHARDFMAGRLYMNPLKYFKRLEETDDGRGDPFEAPTRWDQPKDVQEFSLEVDGHSIPIIPKSPIVFQEDRFDLFNVFCVYAFTAHGLDRVTPKTAVDFKNALKIPVSCDELGEFAVIVYHPREFIARVAAAVRAHGYSCRAKAVSYFDPDSHSGPLADPCFAKRQSLSWQHEFRIVLDTRARFPKPCILEVGPLDDICKLFRSKDINESIEIRFE